MKRLPIALVLVASLIASPSIAAVKDGAKCTKAGQVKSASGSQFKCVKKGNKLIWQKSKETKQTAPQTIPNPAPSSTSSVNPQPSITPVPTVSPSPISTPRPTRKPQYFSFKVENEVLYRTHDGAEGWYTNDDRTTNQFDPIRAKAWQEIKSVLPKNGLTNQKIKYFVAPNINSEVKVAYETLIKQSLLYFENWVAPGSDLNIHVYSEKDRDFFRESMQIYLNGDREYERLEKDLRNYDDPNSGFSPGGGVTGASLKSDPNGSINFATFHMSSRLTNEKILMYLIPHEISHHWQFSNLQPTLRRQNSERSSCNFLEGTAVLLGASITVNHLGWYSDEMDVITRRIARDNPRFKPVSEKDIVEDLMRQSASTATNGLACSTGYSLGAIAYEWLVAEKGISILNTLIDSFNKTTSVSDGIKLATGWTDREFYEKAAPYVLRAWKSALNN